MKYEMTREWLDALVKVYHESRALAEFDTQICICEPFHSGIHIYKGIEIVADVMGLTLTESKRECDDIPYEYSFTYNGVSFFQITEERIGDYARAD